MNRYKPSSEAAQAYAVDAALAARQAELLDAAGEAETQFRQAQARRAPDAEVRRLALALDSALTDAMHAAFATQRAEIGPRGYDDRIYRRKAKAKPHIHALRAPADPARNPSPQRHPGRDVRAQPADGRDHRDLSPPSPGIHPPAVVNLSGCCDVSR
jgi:hypothetical protein